MAQTTEYYSMKNAKLEFSVNGSAWTDASGQSNLVEWDGFERMHEFTHTFDGDTPLLTTANKEGGSVRFRAVYTEGASDIAVTAQTAYDNDTAFYMRWSPRGGASGQKQYTTASGKVIKPVYPAGEVNADAVLVEIEMVTPSIAVATVA
jgi:hypothetical protein